MRTTAFYPAIVTARAPKKTLSGNCLVQLPTEVDIPEMEDDQAPVGMILSGSYHDRVKNWTRDVASRWSGGEGSLGSGLPIRHHAGRHYRPVLPAASKNLAAFLSAPFGSYDLLGGIRQELLETHRNLPPGNAPDWPKEGYFYLKDGNDAGLFAKVRGIVEKQSPSVVLDEDAEEQSAAWRAKFEAALSGCVIVDDTLWTRCPEPAFGVTTRIKGTVHAAMHSPVPFDRRADHLMRPDTDVFLFAGDSLDEAMAFLSTIAEDMSIARHSVLIGGEGIEVLDGAALTTDFAAMGLQTMARDLVDMASTLRDPDAGAIGELRRLLDGYDPLDGIPETLDAYTIAAVEEYAAMDGITTSWAAQFERHLRRWNERSISLSDTAGAPAP